MTKEISLTAKEGIPQKKIERLKDWIKTHKKWILGVSLGLLLLIGGYYGFKAFQFTTQVGLKITPNDIISPIKKDPELKRDSTGKYTTALIVGIDTRGTNSSLKNTDTMMLVSHNYETHDTIIISIPRDFFVPVPGSNGAYTKINALYNIGEQREEGEGIPLLEEVFEDITELEIQYYAMVDLEGFRTIVDAVGGLTINVENAFTDYQYPSDTIYAGYQTVSFEAGPQLMDGNTALQYARSRKSGDNGEGSDFARARRQQRVIIALKDKLLSSNTILNPQKVLEILTAVEENVTLSQFTNEDIQAVISLAQVVDKEKGKIYSFVLDPSIADYGILTTQGLVTDGAYVIGPKLGLGNYDDLHKYIQLALANPQIYSKDPSILVYDVGLGYQAAYDKTLELLKKYPYLDITFMGTLRSDQSGIWIYDQSEENPTAVSTFATYLDTENTTKPDYITTNLNGEDITILLGKEIISEEVVE